MTAQSSRVGSLFAHEVHRGHGIDSLRLDNLRTRLSQNSLQEKVTKLWIDRCLRELGARGKSPAHVCGGTKPAMA